MTFQHSWPGDDRSAWNLEDHEYREEDDQNNVNERQVNQSMGGYESAPKEVRPFLYDSITPDLQASIWRHPDHSRFGWHSRFG